MNRQLQEPLKPLPDGYDISPRPGETNAEWVRRFNSLRICVPEDVLGEGPTAAERVTTPQSGRVDHPEE